MVSTQSTGEDFLLRVSLWWWLGVVVAPFLLTTIVLTAVFTATGGESPIPHLSIAVYSILCVFVVASLTQWLSPAIRTKMLPTHIPTRTEVGVAVVATLVTILVFDPIATFAASVLGSGDGNTGSFNSLLGIAIFGVSSVVIAPVVEEYLFRGVALDALRSRYGVVVAVVGSSAVFGGIHLLLGGVSGIVSASLSGVVYAGVRVEFENLTGAIVAHSFNNLYWVLVMAGLVPNIVPG